MKRIYPIMNPIEIGDYNEKDDIFDSDLPKWLKEEMEKVAKKEGCSLRDLSYKREILWDNDSHKWIDIGGISFEKN